MTTATTQPGIHALPVFVSVPVAGAVCERPRMAAYAAARCGDLPTVRFGKRLFVPVARLAKLAGREITAADIARAETIVAARKRQPERADAQ